MSEFSDFQSRDVGVACEHVVVLLQVVLFNMDFIAMHVGDMRGVSDLVQPRVNHLEGHLACY